ncbi:recombinase zinc beta ribbon domain-containing protein [Nocardia sp. R16R-3T]
MRAYGWESNGRTVFPAEAEEINRWAAYLLDTDANTPPTRKGLAEDLQRRGVSTVSGAAWSPVVIRRALVAPRMIGHRFNDAGELVPADMDPILERETWDALRGILLDPALQKYTPARSTVYLLSEALARCDKCASPMVHASNGNRPAVYTCGASIGGCTGMTIRADLIEADITERVLARLTDPKYRRQLARAMAKAGTADDQRAVLADLEDRLAQLGTDYADRAIDRATMLAGTERARANIAAAETAIRRTTALADIPLSVDDVIGWWELAGPEQQHQIVACLLDHVVVKSSEGRQLRGADRLAPVWRTFN